MYHPLLSLQGGSLAFTLDVTIRYAEQSATAYDEQGTTEPYLVIVSQQCRFVLHFSKIFKYFKL